MINRGNGLCIALLCLAALFSFGRTLKTGFMWDDHQMIEANSHIKVWNASNLAHAFTSDPFNQGLNYYRPLQTISNAADFSIWKLNPFGYHLTNLVLHAANAVLCFLLLGELGIGLPAAFAASALFAAHPAAVEQLLIIAGRAEIMAFTFTLLSLLLFFKKSRITFALSLIFFILALLSKETGVIVPLLLPLLLFFKNPGAADGGERQAERALEYKKVLVYFLILPAYFWLRHAAVNLPVTELGGLELFKRSFIRLPEIISAYLYETILPLNFHSHRLQPDYSPASLLYWLPLLAAAWAAARQPQKARQSLVNGWRDNYRARSAVFLAGWYIINLAPKIPSLLSNDLMLDHWVYGANLSVFLGAAIAVEEVKNRAKAYNALRAALVFFFFMCLYQSNRNITLRGTDIKIYEHAVKYTTSSPLRYNLAREYCLRGEPAKAIPLLEAILKKNPGNEMYINGLALAFLREGEVEKAGKLLDSLIDGGKDSETQGNKGSETDTKHAGIKNSEETLYNRAVIFDIAGEKKKAADMLEKLVAAYPDSVEGLNKLAYLRIEEGDKNSALALLEKALFHDPYDPGALISLGAFKAENKDYKGARECWQKALAADPSNKAAGQNLKRLAAMGF